MRRCSALSERYVDDHDILYHAIFIIEFQMQSQRQQKKCKFKESQIPFKTKNRKVTET